MNYDKMISIIELELSVRSKRSTQRYSEISHETTPAIEMIIGDWYVDELGVRTREITARE